MEILTHNQIDKLIKIAMKMPTISIKKVAQETNVNINSLYKWTSGQNRLNQDKIDTILVWFMDCRPDVLEAAKTIFCKRGLNYER